MAGKQVLVALIQLAATAMVAVVLLLGLAAWQRWRANSQAAEACQEARVGTQEVVARAVARGAHPSQLHRVASGELLLVFQAPLAGKAVCTLRFEGGKVVAATTRELD